MANRIFDETHNINVPTLLLKKRDDTAVGVISGASGLVYKNNYNSPNELSFKVYHHTGSPGKDDSLWDEINDYNIICVPEYGEYFDIQVSVSEEAAACKTVTGTALAESELSNTRLYQIEINTEEDMARPDYDENFPTILYRDPEKFFSYDWSDKKYSSYTDEDKIRTIQNASLLHRILEKAPNYRIGFIAPTLRKLTDWYQFQLSDTDIYSVLTGEIAEQYRCRFVFDSHERTVNAYDLCNTCEEASCGYRGDFHDRCPECGSTRFSGADGTDTTIFISRENLASSASVESNKSSLKNCFRVSGGDELLTSAIAMSNPGGTNDIYYFSEEMYQNMPEDLVREIQAYQSRYDAYLNTRVYSFPPDPVADYNRVIQEIAPYGAEGTYSPIPDSVTGYKQIPSLIYGAMDLAWYLQTSMMKTPQLDRQGIDDALAGLTPQSLGEIAVPSSAFAQTIAENAILGVCRLSVNTALYKVNIENTTNWKPCSGNTPGAWTGTFRLTSIADKTVTRISPQAVTLTITNNEEAFLKQKLQKALAQSDHTFKPLQNRIFDKDFDETAFQNELQYYSIDYLQMLSDLFEDCLTIILSSQNTVLQNTYKDLYERYRNTICEMITARTRQLNAVKAFYSYGTEELPYEASGILADIVKEARDALNFENALGKDRWKLFCSYRREDSYKNDNYISDGLNNAQISAKAGELLHAAERELYKAGNMQYRVTASLNNLLALEEFQPLADDFQCGSWIHLAVDNKIYDLRLLSYQIAFDEPDSIDVEFSTAEKIWSGVSDVESILNSAASLAGSYSYTTQKLKKHTAAAKHVEHWVEKGFEATAGKLVNNADNIGVTFDRTGITCARYDDIENKPDDCQTKILDTGLYVTDDAWKAAKCAIGKYIYTDPKGRELTTMGVLADTIVGKFILGENLGIYNSRDSKTNSLTFDENGLEITNGTNTFTVDPNDTKRLLKIRNGTTDIFYVDDKGSLNLTGNVNGCYFNGGRIDIGNGNFMVDSNGNLTTKGNFSISGTSTWDGSKNEMYIGSDGITSVNGKNTLKIYNGSLSFENNNFAMFLSNDSLNFSGKLTNTSTEISNERISANNILIHRGTNTYNLMLATGSTDSHGYYGLVTPDGSELDWIKTTNNGLIPFSPGQSSLGTAAWTFAKSYIDQMSCNNLYFIDESSQHAIFAKMRDHSYHGILVQSEDRGTTYLGWNGSGNDNEKYTANTVLRGSSVRLGSTSGTVVTSDERLKNSFKPLDEFDDVYMNIIPCAFKYKNGTSGRFHYGFKAQNVKDALLNHGFTTQDFGGFVQMSDDPGNDDYCGIDDPMGLIYTEFTAWNTHMIQKIIKENLALKKRLENLERTTA